MHENLLCQRWQRLDCSDRMAAKHSSNYSLPDHRGDDDRRGDEDRRGDDDHHDDEDHGDLI